tara:strand:+ start:404 stop:547 length:144 start_codon:yes stop_codon:yes gene_type:complete
MNDHKQKWNITYGSTLEIEEFEGTFKEAWDHAFTKSKEFQIHASDEK